MTVIDCSTVLFGYRPTFHELRKTDSFSDGLLSVSEDTPQVLNGFRGPRGHGSCSQPREVHKG